MIKLQDILNEGHIISFSKEEMAKLHKDGKLEKDGHTYTFSEGKITEMKVNKGKVDKTYKSVLNHMRKVIKKLNDDEMYEMTTKLKQWFNKNIM